MKISITYCTQWNYEPKATSLAAEIKEKFESEVELIGGAGGIFDVVADGAMIFSKQQEENEFPQHPDVLQRLEKHQAASTSTFLDWRVVFFHFVSSCLDGKGPMNLCFAFVSL